MNGPANSKPRLSRLQFVAFVAIAGVLTFVLLPPLATPPAHTRSAHCRNNLKQIGFAIYEYQQRYKSLPPAYIADVSGRPIHSWRVLLLPFLDEEPLCRDYRFDEPWNGPNNLKLAARIPQAYRCPAFELKWPTAAEAGATSYVAVAGPRTAFDGDISCPESRITDHNYDTILVAETFHRFVNWLQPDDISPTELLMDLQRSARPGQSSHEGGLNVLKADGAVVLLPAGTAPNLVWAMATIDGGTSH